MAESEKRFELVTVNPVYGITSNDPECAENAAGRIRQYKYSLRVLDDDAT